MKYTITNEPHEQLDLTYYEDDRFTLIRRTRSGELGIWTSRVTILNKREALLIHQAIGDSILGKSQYPVKV